VRAIIFVLFVTFAPSILSAAEVEVHHRFIGGTTDGRIPEGQLSVIGDALYGTTDWGGSSDAGTLFRYEPALNSYTIVRHFSGDNIQPIGGPIQVGSKLYGTTYGVNGGRPGTIYSLDPVTNQYATLHTFSNERGPFGGLTQVGSQLWGATNFGGTGERRGVIFSYDTITNQYTVRHRFDGINGALPEGRLTLVGNKLYGTTGEGGVNGVGTIFHFDTQSNSFAKLHDFTRASDGAFPFAHLTPVGAKLYGTSVVGGAEDDGTIFCFDPADNSFDVVHDFEGAPDDGRGVYAGLTLVDSTLYGMTAFGGDANRGAMFRYDLATGDYSMIHSFDIADGYQPQYSLVHLGSRLYGTTVFGGSPTAHSEGGVLFSVAIPEPSSACLMAIAGLMAIGRRQRVAQPVPAQSCR
jgi:uncharacterized repeat protein (TIGR03803 family)